MQLAQPIHQEHKSPQHEEAKIQQESPVVNKEEIHEEKAEKQEKVQVNVNDHEVKVETSGVQASKNQELIEQQGKEESNQVKDQDKEENIQINPDKGKEDAQTPQQNEKIKEQEKGQTQQHIQQAKKYKEDQVKKEEQQLSPQVKHVQQEVVKEQQTRQVLKIQSKDQTDSQLLNKSSSPQLIVENKQAFQDPELAKFQEQKKPDIKQQSEQILATDLTIKQKDNEEGQKCMKINISFVKEQGQQQADQTRKLEIVQDTEEKKQEKPQEKPQQIPDSKQQIVQQANSINEHEVNKQQQKVQEKIKTSQYQQKQNDNQHEQESQQEQEQEQKEVLQKLQQKSKKISPIIMTEENEPYQTINAKGDEPKEKEEVVQFVQYVPIQQKQKQIPVQYQGIQNQTLLKRIQQLQETVKELKTKKQAQSSLISHESEGQGKTAEQTIQKKLEVTQKKNKHKEQVIHDPSVHGLVSQLAKTQSQAGHAVKKPILHEKRYKKRKIDLTALMDKNMGHASNIFNLTIGQILNPNSAHQQQKQQLKKQIKQLREKVLKLEQDKRANSTIKPVPDTKRQTNSTGKKSIYGKLIKVSELKASRVSGLDDNDSIFKINANQNQKNQTRSQRQLLGEGLSLKNKISSNSVTQREQREAQKQKDNINNLSFRVRRPTAKSNGGPTSLSFINNEQQKLSPIPISQKVNKQWWQQPFIKSLNVPDLPSPPSQFDSQQDLYTLGKLTFIAFGVNFDNSKQMTVRKYKNCVYFNLGDQNNILWYFDGRFYIGEWQVHLTGQGQKSGEGFQHVPGKFIYQGQFKQGKRNGFGRIKILNKDKEVMYEGNWLDGSKNGQGKQVDQYGIKYWGEWKQNKREGFGKLKLDDGDYYEGNFQKGIKNGQGTQYFKNGDKYQGNYLGNKFHGKGKYTWKNGSVYEGQFNHGIRSGQGKWKSSQTLTQIDQYEGEYENDKKNGYGKYKWADGSQYEGFFKDDLKEGQGTIRYKNGKVAKLLWRNGQPMKKIFSEEEKKYREGGKSKQKLTDTPKQKSINRNQTLSSKQMSIGRDD